MNKEQIRNTPMLFIVGKGRSGTTLLQTLLDAHPQIILPFESRLIIHLKSKYGKVVNWTDEKLLSFYDDLFTDIKFSTLWKVDNEKLKKSLLEMKGECDYGTICKVVYLNYISLFEKTELKFIGDKNPIYTIFTKELLEIFPGAKFIQLVRDPRDNVFSHLSVFPVKDVAFLSRKWVYYNEECDRLSENFPDQLITVPYEDLAEDPKKELTRICEFLGLTFHSDMLSFHQKTSTSLSRLETYINKFHSNIVNPVNSTKVAAWKGKMPAQKVRIIEYITSEEAWKYGYDLSSEEPGTSLRLSSLLTFPKLWLWKFIVKNYYRAPLFLRSMVTSFFKLLFGKDYKTRKELMTAEARK